jgi:hypothetical protein
MCKNISEELTALIHRTHGTCASWPDACWYFYTTRKHSIPNGLWPRRWRQHFFEKVGACLPNYTAWSVSIIVQRDAAIYSFIIFLQTPPRQRTVANTVRPVPDVVITAWMCSWCWMRLSSETCRAVCRNIIKLYIVASRWTIIDIDSRCTEPWT